MHWNNENGRNNGIVKNSLEFWNNQYELEKLEFKSWEMIEND